tara:strand:+ start:744 stop:1667 length:924 start_codon:yes stop_codon:yes gene_type:complete
MNKNNLIKFIFLFIFVFFSTNLQSSINNSIIISVGNSPITSLDLLKEMKLISFVTKNKINDSNKEQIKQMAVQSLIKRKIKEIEITKYEINNYNAKDLENMIERTSRNLGVDKNGLAILMRNNNLNIKNLEDKYKIDLKWNTLIFELYKNKISLNMSDIEKKINSRLEKLDSNRKFLLSEIEIQKEGKYNLDFIMDSINKDGFENTAKKFSVSQSAGYGGNIGWVDEKKLSNKIYENIKNLNTDEISKPIIFDTTIVIIKKMGEKVYEKNIQEIKDTIVRVEKEKKLQMFSNSHYSNLEKVIQINFL